MSFLKGIRNWMRRARGRIASLNPRTVVVIVVLGGVAVAGGVWLTRSAGGPGMVLLDETLSPGDLTATRELLNSRGIVHHRRNGKLYVSSRTVEEVRSILTGEGLLPTEADTGFEELTRESDVWRTEAQNAKRWQAAKMAALSRLIGRFPSVRSATVIFEPGIPRTLGRAAVAPTAAVKVCLKDGVRMPPELIAAIADLIAGSVAGMSCEDVRIVDNTGRSYRVGEEKFTAGAGGLEERRAAEAHYVQKIQAALAYIESTVVGVNVGPGSGEERRVSAWVAVPRSYVVAIHRATHGGAGGVDDERLGAIAEVQLGKIQEAVMRLIGAAEAADVKVDWYYDVSAEAVTTAQPAVPRADSVEVGWMKRSSGVTAGVCLAAGVVCAVGAVVRYRCKAGASTEMGREEAEQEAQSSTDAQVDVQRGDPGSGEPSAPFAFLKGLDPERIAGMIGGERPQTIALILANVEAAKAARVLASLPVGPQVEVVECLAGPQEMDEQILREVERGLAARAAEVTNGRGKSAGGVEAVAEILQHTGYQTERAVLDGVRRHEPALAESIRNRMFAFEDIARVPARDLREALESIESDELAVALRTADEQVRKKIFSGLSFTAARRVRQAMERIGPVRLSDVEAAQQRVVEAIRQARAGRYVRTAESERKTLRAQRA